MTYLWQILLDFNILKESDSMHDVLPGKVQLEHSGFKILGDLVNLGKQISKFWFLTFFSNQLA
jgi:hypothetical protein